MVKQLIVLGNGFDRAAGLESDYEGFINALLKESDLTPEQAVQGMEWLLRSIDHSNQAEMNYETRAVKMNAWILLLLNAKLAGDSTWANVEDKMRWYLDDGIIQKIASAVSSTNISFVDTNDIVDAGIKIIALKLKQSGKIEMSSEDVAKYLYEQLHDLESLFESYLFASAGYKSKNIQYFKAARRLLIKMVGKDADYNMLSFNYTDPWNSRWNSQSSQNSFVLPTKVNNVHGEAILDDGTQNRLIFGVDSIGISPESLEYMFTKSFRTMIMSADPMIHPSVHRDDVFDKEVTDIKFYGHSLAPADYAYFQQMFDFYNLYENNNITLTFYYTPYGDQTPMDAIRWQASAVSKLIEKYGETLDNGKPGKGKNLFTRLQLLGRIKIQQI